MSRAGHLLLCRLLPRRLACPSRCRRKKWTKTRSPPPARGTPPAAARPQALPRRRAWNSPGRSAEFGRAGRRPFPAAGATARRRRRAAWSALSSPDQPGQAAVPPPGQRLQTPRGAQPPGGATPQPQDEIVTEMPSQKIANPTAVFAGLDKITGRIIAFEVGLNEKVQFGALQVTPRVCYTRPPTETANTDSFIEVDEVTLQGEVKRLFTGWMFAASPGLHAVEHPIYDVWLTDCKGAATAVSDAQPGAPATPASAPAQRPRTGTAAAGAAPPAGAAGAAAPRPPAPPRPAQQAQPQQQDLAPVPPPFRR